MHTHWLSLVPPIIVLIAALVTKRLNSSLIIGIVVAALIAADGSIGSAFTLAYTHLAEQLFNIDKLYLYAFLISISSFITLLSFTGGAVAFAQIITKRLRSIKMVETSTALLSCVLFIDDYLSNLTVGYVMRPMTDKFHIPRAKLAFLVHSLSGPLVVLAPVSSWVAMTTGQYEAAGISPTVSVATKIIGEPFYIFIQTIPFIFYSLLMITSVWFIIFFKISYGPMRRHELIAREEKNMYGGKNPPRERLTSVETPHGSAIDLILPMVILIVCVLLGILYVGNHWVFGGLYGFIDAVQHNNRTELVLFGAGMITLTVAFAMALWRRAIKPFDICASIVGGFYLMYPAILMVILASTLGVILKADLMTGKYLADTLLGSLNPALLPFMFYVVSCIIAFVTGSSWGTIALMVPIGVPMLVTFASTTTPIEPSALPLLLPLLGAILSGAVCGDHISPISETTIMAATSSGSYPLDHAQTQFWYALPAVVWSGIGFLITGYCANLGSFTALALGLAVAMLCCFATLLIATRVAKAR